MKHAVHIWGVLAIALAAASCSKNADAILSRVTTFANASGGKLLTDNGETFIVNKSTDSIDLSSGRYHLTCDIVSKRNEKTCDVNVISIQPALVKDIKNTGTPLDPEETVNDPVSLENVWFSGGYVNMEIVVFIISDSGTKHLINLLLDTERSNADTLFMDVRHNAYGEYPDNPEMKGRNFLGGRAYASFPLSSLPSPISKGMAVQFRFLWYDDLEKYTRSKYTVTGTYNPEN